MANPLLDDPDFSPVQDTAAASAPRGSANPLLDDPDFAPAPSAVSPDARQNPSTSYRWGSQNPPPPSGAPASVPVDTWTDVGKSAAAQGGLGVSDIAGVPGSLGQMYDAGVNKLYSGVGHFGEYLGAIPPGKTDEFMASAAELGKNFQSPAEQKGLVNTISGVPLPTGAGVESVVKEKAPFTQYEPQTNAGRFAGSAARMASGVATTGGLGAANVVGNVVKGAAAGAGSELIGHAAESYGLPTWADPIARTFGAIGGGGLAHGVTSAVATVALPNAGARTALAGAMATDARNNKLRMTPEQVQQAHDAGLTPTVHDMGGPATDKLLGYYGQLTPEAQQESGALLAAQQSRRAEAGAVTGQHINDLYGGSLDPAKQQAAIDAANTAANNRLYGIARSVPAANEVWSPELHDLVQSDPVRKAWGVANSVATDSQSGLKGYMPAANGQAASYPNLMFWDQMKRNLDDQISAAQRAGASDEARRLVGMKQRLTGALDAAVPEYAVARNTAAEGFGASNALEAGYNSMKNMDAFKAADVSNALAKMPQDQRDLFGQGAAGWMKEQVENPAKGPGFLARQFTNPTFAARAKAAVGEDNFNSIQGHAAASDLLSKVKPIAASAKAPPTSHIFDTVGKYAGAAAGAAADLGMLHLGAGTPYLGTMAAAALGGVGGHYVGQAVDSVMQTGARMRAAPMLRQAAETNPDAVAAFGRELSNNPEARKGYSRASQYLGEKALQAYRANPNFTPDQSYQQPLPQRAAGGAVGGHQHLVDRLLSAVERAKREEKEHTKPILHMPDEAVASALNKAQEAI